MDKDMAKSLQLLLDQHLATGQFQAMASPCQLLIDTQDWQLAARLLELVATEAWRIEHKYSRYQADSVVGQLHQHVDQWFAVDAETCQLLNFADTLYQLSEGAFDISSGVLRQIWRFDGSDRIPTAAAVQAMLPRIGWSKIGWQSTTQQVYLPAGMEIDLGGIGKEYAVDRCFDLVAQQFDGAFLINFGGDLRARGRRQDGQAWHVGLERPDTDGQAAAQFELVTGALATSGDAKRYLLKDGVRYGHILDPRTGYSVQGAPRSITILADTCTQAGMLATLAMLQGQYAKDFLAQQTEGQAWIVD